MPNDPRTQETSEPPFDRAGTPESPAEFRALLAEIGQTQWSFGRTLKRLGDDRMPATIQRHSSASRRARPGFLATCA
jgi:hypothetical protein